MGHISGMLYSTYAMKIGGYSFPLYSVTSSPKDSRSGRKLDVGKGFDAMKLLRNVQCACLIGTDGWEYHPHGWVGPVNMLSQQIKQTRLDSQEQRRGREGREQKQQHDALQGAS